MPDVIICTHVFAAQMVDELKKRKKLADIETIGIVTDYTLHPYWEDVPRVQYIVTASELLTYRCVQRGIPEDRIPAVWHSGAPEIQRKAVPRGRGGTARH